MPFYEFQCPKCGKTLEKLLPISKRNEEQLCVHCNTKLDRVISNPTSLIFKGEGFYCNDYPKENN